MLQDWLGTEALVLGVLRAVFVGNAIYTSGDIIIFCISLVHCGNVVLCSPQLNVRVALSDCIAVTRFSTIFVILYPSPKAVSSSPVSASISS